MKACDTWHPETTSRIRLQKRGKRNGQQAYGRQCLECQRIKTELHRHNVRSNLPYGVIPLNWPVPQL